VYQVTGVGLILAFGDERIWWDGGSKFKRAKNEKGYNRGLTLILKYFRIIAYNEFLSNCMGSWA